MKKICKNCNGNGTVPTKHLNPVFRWAICPKCKGTKIDEKEQGVSKEQRKEFEELSRPLIKFLNDNFNPHIQVLIGSTFAEILEGLACINTEDYIRD